MILCTEKLNNAIKKAGLTKEQLAQAIARPGLPERHALSALRNWTRGAWMPKPKPVDLEALANALDVEITDIVWFDSSYKWARIAPRKARLVADLIRGHDIDTALTQLRISKKRAAVMLRKALQAAIASAEQNNADITRLVVAESRVDEGPTIKRFQPKDRGRAHPIMKRTSHFVVAVAEE